MSMNKKVITGTAVILAIIITVTMVSSLSSDEPIKKKNLIFHATLADPKLYVDGTYTDTFTIKPGEYFFRFIPNGSSPKILSIILSGDSFEYTENFKRVGTSHQTGISEYYTWDYDGQKNIIISEIQQITITIDPNGETLGSVSVDILED